MNIAIPENQIIARQSHLNSTAKYGPLVDSHNRKFSYLRLSITDVCNYKCDYCLPNGYQCNEKKQPLTLNEITDLVTLMAKKGIRKVRITGGEPSIRSDLCEIIQNIKNIEGIETVSLTTNGYKLNHYIKKWIESGLDAINVSIDSLQSHRFYNITGHDRLSEIIDGLTKAESLDFKNIKINAVLLKQFNVNEFYDFMSWIKYKPYTIRFIELMETSDNREYFKLNHISGHTIQSQLLSQGWTLIEKNTNSGPANEYSHPDYIGRIGLIMPYSQDFCKSCNRLRISSDGKLHLCLFGEHGHNIRPLLGAQQHVQLNNLLDDILGLKDSSHYLQQNNTGGTQHLAMLGG